MTPRDARIPLVKAHAYGNDFLLVRAEDVEGVDLPSAGRAICDRHRGVGADGLITYRLTPGGASMTLTNSDGSPAEVSGNGVRCLAAWIAANAPESDRHRRIVIDSAGGTKTLDLVERNGTRLAFRAQMGAPGSWRELRLDVQGETLQAVALWMGNPQCVVLGPLPDPDRFARLGPALSTHPVFPSGTNVEFATVDAPDRISILIWERGAGPTLSSGTGSCAAAVVASRYGGAKRALEVTAPGGTQRVDWQEGGVVLTGWAEIVLEGTWVAQLP